MKTTKKTTKQPTAAQVYAERYARLQATVAAFQRKLEAHREAAARQPGNWGYAGDLGAFLERFDDLGLDVERSARG